MSQHYSKSLAKDKLNLLAKLIEQAKLGQDQLNNERLKAGKPKLDNKWWRGVNVVKTAPDYSPVLSKFLDKIKDGKNVSHKEVYSAFEYIRKFDDNLLRKLKITQGDEIHHAIGYAEFARSVSQLSPDDQVRAFTYLSENDFPLGTSTPNVKDGALGKPAHRNPSAIGNPDWLSAHFKNNGVPLELDKMPTNYDEWVKVWENKIVPQAYTGATLGRFADEPRLVKMYDEVTKHTEQIEALAKKHSVNPNDIVSSIFSRVPGDPALKAANELRKNIGLDETMSTFRQGPSDQKLIFDQLDEVGFDVDVAKKQLKIPNSINKGIFKKGASAKEILDQTGAVLNRNALKLARPLTKGGGLLLDGMASIAGTRGAADKKKNILQRIAAGTDAASGALGIGSLMKPTLGPLSIGAGLFAAGDTTLPDIANAVAPFVPAPTIRAGKDSTGDVGRDTGKALMKPLQIMQKKAQEMKDSVAHKNNPNDYGITEALRINGPNQLKIFADLQGALRLGSR